MREFQWTNPHAFIHIEVPNDSGGKELWQVELNSPNNLKRQGWKSTSIKAGDAVTLVLNPLRDGSKGGLVRVGETAGWVGARRSDARRRRRPSTSRSRRRLRELPVRRPHRSDGCGSGAGSAGRLAAGMGPSFGRHVRQDPRDRDQRRGERVRVDQPAFVFQGGSRSVAGVVHRDECAPRIWCTRAGRKHHQRRATR